MIAAIKAYSMDVAPSSSAANVMRLDRVIWGISKGLPEKKHVRRLLSRRALGPLCRDVMIATPELRSEILLYGCAEFVVHLVEGGLQARADVLQNCDDADADDGSDKAIFDSRGARLILHETRENGH
jgi:hypothetical protein